MKVTTKFKTFGPNDVPSQCFDLTSRNNPTIIQIGAHDGIVGEEYGFQEFLHELDSFNLYLLEPLEKYFKNLPSVYQKFSSENKKVHYCNHAITEQDGEMSMVDRGGMSHISNTGEIKIKCKTWESFLRDNNINSVDLIILDCEGYEFNIMKQIQYDKMAPKVIRYEYFHIPNKKETDDFLVSNGYEINLCETDPPYNKVAKYVEKV